MKKSNPADDAAYETWLTATGGYARDMTLLDQVALRIYVDMLKNGDTIYQEDATDAYIAATAFLKVRQERF
jgi:hypothetical protein